LFKIDANYKSQVSPFQPLEALKTQMKIQLERYLAFILATTMVALGEEKHEVLRVALDAHLVSNTAYVRTYAYLWI
jgi:hypothetical protein